MRKNPNKDKSSGCLESQSTAFAALLNALDPEREAQHQEFLRRFNQKEKASLRSHPKEKANKPKKSPKSKGLTFEQKLEKTNAWLAQTFPILFDPNQSPKLLDVHTVRDIVRVQG